MPQALPNFDEIFAYPPPPEQAQAGDLKLCLGFMRQAFWDDKDKLCLEYIEAARQLSLTRRDLLSRSGDEICRSNLTGFAMGIAKKVDDHLGRDVLLPIEDEKEKDALDEKINNSLVAAAEAFVEPDDGEEIESVAPLIEVAEKIKARNPAIFLDCMDCVRKLNDTESKLRQHYTQNVSRFRIYQAAAVVFRLYAAAFAPDGNELFEDALQWLEDFANETAASIRAME